MFFVSGRLYVRYPCTVGAKRGPVSVDLRITAAEKKDIAYNGLLFYFRKHALNCHRMKPALFNVLCEIKEKTGKRCFLFYLMCVLISFPCLIIVDK